MAKNYVAAVDGVLVRVGNTAVSLYKDGGVPDGADPNHVGLLVDRGLLVTSGADDVDDVDGDGPIPPKSADKATWVTYAETKGFDPAQADATTKDQLIEQYGQA